MRIIPKGISKKHPGTFKKSTPAAIDNTLRHLAFNNSLQPNIISTVSSGKIIIANNAACILLGYSKKELLAQSRGTIFNINESSFKKMLKQRTADGQSTALITAIKKGGKPFPCEITSAVFMDENGTEKSVITITDMSQSILKQKNIHTKNEKIVADNIVLAKSKQKDIDIRKEKIVADNIVLAKSRQKEIDAKNEKIVADNIVLAKSKQKDIDTRKEKIVADNIVLAKSKQKEIDAKNKKIVADNINLAQVISDTRQAENNEWIKKIGEKREQERSDIATTLQENVNQLLCASKLYLNLAKGGGENNEIFLSRASQFTLMAIEEIRKLTKVLTTDAIKYFGLCKSIENVVQDMMEGNPVKISCALKSFIEPGVNNKFKLHVLTIVQEQLKNILNHAGATNVAINLSQNKKSVKLSISDDGIGFDTGKKSKGFGIDNIKSLATSYKGTSDFVSQPGQGCVLTVTFSLTDALLDEE
jgi:PAS domain S-box-containing protein